MIVPASVPLDQSKLCMNYYIYINYRINIEVETCGVSCFVSEITIKLISLRTQTFIYPYRESRGYVYEK